MADTGSLERRLGDWARARLPEHAAAFVMFALKQAWAALFGGLFLIALIVTRAVWQPDWPVTRYDALFVFAVVTQGLFLAFKLESWAEARVIALFHLTGTAMEVFKLRMGSWDYPDTGLFEIAGVPLFSGFMYACVGSYIARVIRIFRMRFAPYPPFWATVLLAVAIYGNFFGHHFGPDIRAVLFVAAIALFARTRIWFYPDRRPYWMPLPLAAFLAALFLWIAENVGTFTQTWVYAGQGHFDLVSLGKLGSWFLLLHVSFVTVTLVSREALFRQPQRPGPITDGATGEHGADRLHDTSTETTT